MSAAGVELRSKEEFRILLVSVIAAFTVEFLMLVAVGINQHWIAHPQKTTGLDAEKFIQAEVYQIPKNTNLMEEKKSMAGPPQKEATLSKVPNQGATAKGNEKPLEEKNITKEGTLFPPTHGPVAVYAPLPVIPSYLQDKELKAHVTIDFFITAQGYVTPRLVSSSGYDELDATALKTVKEWHFRPAEQDHKPIDSKIRLRVEFEVQ